MSWPSLIRASFAGTFPGMPFDEDVDAARRTHLANERTYLAWFRSGITCLAVSFGTGKIVPSLANETRWPYAVLGAAFAILGLVFIVYGLQRQREVHAAVQSGGSPRSNEGVLLALTVFGAVLAVGVLLLVSFKT
jgi:putative membrane protein